MLPVKVILPILVGVGLWLITPRSPRPTSRYSWLALGDSYTIGQSVDPGQRYPVQAARLLTHDGELCMDPTIVAATGWTTANLLRALDADSLSAPYSFVSLLIGVNNQYQGRSMEEYNEELKRLLERSIYLAGGNASHVLVLSIPDYGVSPFGQASGEAVRIAEQIDSFNAMNHRLALAYKVHYLDITTESRKAANDASMFASDGLHYSGKEYGRWAELMLPVMEQMK